MPNTEKKVLHFCIFCIEYFPDSLSGIRIGDQRDQKIILLYNIMADKLFKLICAYHKDTVRFDGEQKLYYDELKELKRRHFRKILEQEYYLETLGDYYKEMKQIEEKNVDLIRERVAISHNNLYVWVTINPKSDITLEVFKRKMEKLAHRKIFTEAKYVFEQRGTDEQTLGNGMHCHLLARRNLSYKPFKVKECIQNTCKGIVGNVKSSNLVNVQNIGEEFAKDKLEYILGTKTGEGKDQKQKMDPIWRKKNNIAIYYNVEKTE